MLFFRNIAQTSSTFIIYVYGFDCHSNCCIIFALKLLASNVDSYCAMETIVLKAKFGVISMLNRTWLLRLTNFSTQACTLQNKELNQEKYCLKKKLKVRNRRRTTHTKIFFSNLQKPHPKKILKLEKEKQFQI